MFKMLSFRLYLIINKKDIQFVHKLLDSPSYSRSFAQALFFSNDCQVILYIYSTFVVCIYKRTVILYTRHKKKRISKIFPLSSHFNVKMLIVIKYLISIKCY